MVYDGNRDWVSANGNREVANVVMTNFNQPQGNPEMGQFSNKSSIYASMQVYTCLYKI